MLVVMSGWWFRSTLRLVWLARISRQVTGVQEGLPANAAVPPPVSLLRRRLPAAPAPRGPWEDARAPHAACARCPPRARAGVTRRDLAAGLSSLGRDTPSWFPRAPRQSRV